MWGKSKDTTKKDEFRPKKGQKGPKRGGKS